MTDKHEKKEEAKEEAQNEKNDAEQKAKEYKDSLLRLAAEFENYKKRADKQCADARKYANADLVKSMLPVLDSFDMALKNKDDLKKFAKGVEMIYAQLYSILEENGLSAIKAEGEPDPYLHEVLLQEESEADGKILEELQRGYRFSDMIIRHSKVKVGKKKEDKNES